MRDTELYDRILDLKQPWKVEAVKLEMEKKTVEVRVGYAAGTLWASEEGERLPTYDHVERRWRHLDTCGFETVMVCRVPRRQTPAGQVETVPVPWAGRGSRFTLLFERVASWFGQPCVRLIHPTEFHWRMFQEQLRETGASGNLVSDAHLAALAIEHGAILYSSDNDFARFPSLSG